VKHAVQTLPSAGKIAPGLQARLRAGVNYNRTRPLLRGAHPTCGSHADRTI
jgi:hypothetical protein